MSQRSCCLKLKECQPAFKGKIDAMIFLVEECAKDNIPLPPKVENDLVLMIDSALGQADVVNQHLKDLLGL